MLSLLFSLFLSPCAGFAAIGEEEVPAYWEYGAGFGYVHYEHYPAANQFSNLLLPFPTFQYRGKTLRADDREGAHAYLFKGSRWTLELSGAGYPALDSSNNEARRGMDNLPWMIALGPQLVSQFESDFQMSLGVYQAVSTDFSMTRFAGGVFSGRLMYGWGSHFEKWGFFEAGRSFSKLFYTIKGGSKEFLSVYYEVPGDKVTADRSAFDAKEGLLSQEISFFQAFKSGRTSLYMGLSYEDYAVSVNRRSPLHKSDHNTTYVVGMTYTLGESAKPEVPEKDTSGLINRWRQREPF